MMRNIFILTIIALTMTSCYVAHTGTHIEGNYVQPADETSNPIEYVETIDIFSEYNDDTLLTSQIFLIEDLKTNDKYAYFILPLRDTKRSKARHDVRIEFDEIDEIIGVLNYLAKYETIKPTANSSSCNFRTRNDVMLSVSYDNSKTKSDWVFSIGLKEIEKGSSYTKTFPMEYIQYLRNTLSEAQKTMKAFYAGERKKGSDE